MGFIAPPFVVIIGFDNEKEINDTVEKFIAETGQYLFTVVRGYIGERDIRKTALDDWCEWAGAPQVYIGAKSQASLVAVMNHWVDYVIAKITPETPQAVKNFVMSMKGLGKHGMVVR